MGKRTAQRSRQQRREQEREKLFETLHLQKNVPSSSSVANERELHFEKVTGPAVITNTASYPNAPTNGHETTRAIDAVSQVVERQLAESKQPRFNQLNATSVFNSIWSWVKVGALKNEPSDLANIRQWDTYLREFVLREPYLAGVYNSVVQIDKNRGYSIIGGRNQVLRYSDILHEADDGAGWRSYLAWQAQSYYSTRAGFITEVGSEGEGGPLRALWSLDSARVELNADNEYPLTYFPPVGAQQKWTALDFFRDASLKSTDETKRGYGFPANARCYDLAKLMVAVWEHDQEQLAARAPNGLLLLNGISENQWDTAMQAREEVLDSKQRRAYGGVAILASDGATKVEAALFALSQLPKDFDLRQWVSLLMFGYALAYGYDAREFFPVDSGSLGSAKETEVQHRKASSKGELDFPLAHQEQLQRRLPETLQFEYEQRDASGEQLDAQLAQQKAAVITEANKWTINGQNVLTAEQILQMAAAAGVVPEEWTLPEEDVTVTDTDEAELRTRVLQMPNIQRALEVFPDEPIVIYNSTTKRMRTILEPHTGDKRQRFFVRRVSVQSIADKFKRNLRAEVRLYCQSKSTFDLLQEQVRLLVSEAVSNAYYAGLQEGGISPEEFTADDSQRADDLTYEQLSYVDNFLEYVQDNCDAQDSIYARVEKWTQSVAGAGMTGLNTAKGNEYATWRLGENEQHCKTCKSLNGKRHRRKWYEEKNYIPGKPGAAMECGGYNCSCYFE